MTKSDTDATVTYGSYLRVPELLSLQTMRSDVSGEMLFIVTQQAQELWFRQLLFDLRPVIDAVIDARVTEALRLLDRCIRILRALGNETEILETLPPEEFLRFRSVLGHGSGFQSEQFRELEYASGLPPRERLDLRPLVDNADWSNRWPVSLRDALDHALAAVDPDTDVAALRVLEAPQEHPALSLLLESLLEYELRFRDWRFRHVTLVERVIGVQATGTGGSAGSGYLTRTLEYRFFPQLWEARNRLQVKESS